MNDKSDKTIEGVEMVFSVGTTLGIVSEMSDDVMRSVYTVSHTISRSGKFFTEFYALFTTSINQNPDFDIIDPQSYFLFSDFRYGFLLSIANIKVKWKKG